MAAGAGMSLIRIEASGHIDLSFQLPVIKLGVSETCQINMKHFVTLTIPHVLEISVLHFSALVIRSPC